MNYLIGKWITGDPKRVAEEAFSPTVLVMVKVNASEEGTRCLDRFDYNESTWDLNGRNVFRWLDEESDIGSETSPSIYLKIDRPLEGYEDCNPDAILDDFIESSRYSEWEYELLDQES